MSRRWRHPRISRGQFLWTPPPAVTPPAAPAYPPGFIRQAVRRILFLRPRNVIEPPWLQATQPLTPVAIRRRVGLVARRGELLAVPPAAPVTGAPGPLVQPPYRQNSRRGILCRRGQFYKLPLVGGAPLTPTTWPPPIITARRHRTYPTRRRAPLTVPNATLPPCSYIDSRRSPARPIRRGRFFAPSWPQVVIAPPTYPPGRIVARRRPIPRLRGMHCRFFEPGWPQAISAIIPKAGQIEPGIRTYASVEPGKRAGASIEPVTHGAVTIAGGSKTSAQVEPGSKTGSNMEGGV